MKLLSDLFPGVEVSRKSDLDFEAVVKETVVKNNLTPDD
jgi:hypothetical protein